MERISNERLNDLIGQWEGTPIGSYLGDINHALLELRAYRKSGALEALRAARNLDGLAYSQALAGFHEHNRREEELGNKIDAAKDLVNRALAALEGIDSGAVDESNALNSMKF